MKPLLAALAFLTIIPLPSRYRCDEAELARALPWFPLVGLIIGLILVLEWLLLSLLLPPLAVAALCVATLAWLPGGMHIDGLADTADGFLSGQQGDRLIEIMKDPATGAFGMLAILTLLLTQWGTLAGMTPAATLFALLLTPLAGRAAMAMVIATLPYAHEKRGGLGAIFQDKNHSATAALIASCVITLATICGMVIFGWSALLLPFGWGLTAALFSSYAMRKLGGHTGDTYGALNELTETVTLLMVAIIS